jgi:predicted metalloendopeptidase
MLLGLTLVQCRGPVQPPRGQVEEIQRRRADGANPMRVTESIAKALAPAVDPCQDFFRYACGGWLAGETKGRAWERLQEQTALQAWQAIESVAQSSAADVGSAKLRDFHASCTDTEAIRRAQRSAIESLSKQVAAIESLEALMAALASLHRAGVPALFRLEVQPLPQDPSRYGPDLFAAGLSLIAPELYLQDNPLARSARNWLRDGVRGVRSPIDLADDAGEVVQFETELARIWPAREQQRDPDRWRRVDRAALRALAPLPWDPYFREIGLGDDAEINLVPSDYIVELARLLMRSDLDAVRGYVAWQLDSATRMLVPDFQWIQWKSCAGAAEALFPDLVARTYAHRYVDPAQQQQASEIWETLRASFVQRIQRSEWLPESARTFAQRKIMTIEPIIGFGGPADDYSSLTVARDHLTENVLNGHRFWFAQKLARVGQPVERQRPFLSAFAPTAAYDTRLNQVVIPLGLLQPPLFGAVVPEAVQFGGLGFIMAHEMAHALDRGSRRFDERGGAVPPLQTDVQERLRDRERCVATAFEQQRAAPEIYFWPTASTLPEMSVNVGLTLDENVADLVGVRVAFDAFREWRKTHGPSTLTIAGLGGDQLFFVGFAQAWCADPHKVMRHVQALFDAHSPQEARVNVILAHVPEFALAFQCKAGSPMRAEPPCEVW